MARFVLCENEHQSDVMFYCPGCDAHHAIRVKSDHGQIVWSWNGDLDRATFSPSLVTWWGPAEEPRRHVCHSFVIDGRIQYLGDCTHSLAGQTIEIPDISAIERARADHDGA